MVKSVFAKITDAKRFLCFLMIKNTPAERKSPWDNHKSFRSTTSITTVAAAAGTTATKAAEILVVIPGTFPLSWSVFYCKKKHKNCLASVIFAKMDLTISPLNITSGFENLCHIEQFAIWPNALFAE